MLVRVAHHREETIILFDEKSQVRLERSCGSGRPAEVRSVETKSLFQDGANGGVHRCLA